MEAASPLGAERMTDGSKTRATIPEPIKIVTCNGEKEGRTGWAKRENLRPGSITSQGLQTILADEPINEPTRDSLQTSRGS